MIIQSVNNSQSFGRIAEVEKSLVQIKKEKRIDKYANRLVQMVKNGDKSASDLYKSYTDSQWFGRKNLETAIKKAIKELFAI